MNPFIANSSKKWFFKVTLLLAIGMTGCGGGGGGTAGSGGAVTSNQSFPFKTAYTNLVKSTATLPFTVTVAGQNGTGNLSQSALSNSLFQSVSVLSKTITANSLMNINGVSTPSVLIATYYFDSNYFPVGSTEGADCTKVKGVVNIPETVKVGDSGLLYNFSGFGGCVNALENRFGTVTYSIEPDTANSVIVKLTEVQKNILNWVTKTVVTSISVDVNGGAKRMSETSVDQYNVTTTLTYK
jgi:hypothetical protein